MCSFLVLTQERNQRRSSLSSIVFRSRTKFSFLLRCLAGPEEGRRNEVERGSEVRRLIADSYEIQKRNIIDMLLRGKWQEVVEE